ncbi:MAG TPA: amidohydrolase family protein [Chloroflexota bacterium]
MSAGPQQIHDSLGHPVIDGDGHWLEPIPVFLEYLAEVGGSGAVDRIRELWRQSDEWYRVGWDERQHKRLRRTIWWGVTSNTLDKATALLPALLNERLPELGIDFAVIYPSFGLTIAGIPDNELHKAACRAYNMLTADMFDPYAARFAPAAIIPCRTPEDALEELNWAVTERGYKVMMMRGNIERPIPAAAEGIDSRKAAWYIDTIALDSPHDYDAMWRKCMELGVAVTQHAGSPRWVARASISNFTYNHVGHFADSNHAFARGAFLGGLTHRFPTLNFGFLEGGVSWACQLYADLVAHWEKRRKSGLQYPTRTDRTEMRRLIAQYGDERLKASADALLNNLDAFRPEHSLEELEDQEVHDDFEASGVNSKDDIRQAYSTNFYFGCEADDPGTMWAFDPRLGTRLRPIFSSDFTHFDVPDFREVLPEAYELVEDHGLTEQDFKEFTFTNTARLHTRGNPGFFKGTVVERAVAEELGLKEAAA